ncbi:MAG: prevent-host-death protein [Eubacteriaceae bacterium]|nr:prevent-host-death protein [Eubacteriaceae bacterium]
MPNIKPAADLSNYNEVLSEVGIGEPVFLTIGGRGRYVILDIEEYEKTHAVIRIATELAKGEYSGNANGWIPIAEAEEALGAIEE